MLRNYLAAALRSLARSRLYSAISVFGLATGLCAALLVALVLHSETTFDHAVPGHERIYLLGSVLLPSGHPPMYGAESSSWVAAALMPRFSQIEAVTRVSLQTVQLRQQRVEAQELLYWADPNVFEVLPLPSIAGDLRTALHRPDSIVLTRSMARKYFGRDTPLGELIVLGDAHPMRVTAIIEDLPDHGTQFESGIFAAGLSSYSALTRLDADPQNRPDSVGFTVTVRTYLRLAAGASVEALQEAMPQFMRSLRPDERMPVGVHTSLQLMRLDRVHLSDAINPGIIGRMAVVALIASLILLIAVVNFVNLSTARSTRRALEVGIRKACGAGRRSLVLQFLGESLIYTLIATVVAIMLVELSLPAVNAFLQSGATFMWWRQPMMLACIGSGAVAVALLAGLYPAFVLSSFRPATTLRGRGAGLSGASGRTILVGAQFAILIGLIIAAGVVYEQREYATHEALRIDADQILLVRAPCTPSLEATMRALPGVRGAVCSDDSLLTRAVFDNFRLRDGSAVAIDMHQAEAGIFTLYGLKTLAGSVPSYADAQPSRAGRIGFVVNETAVRRLGFPSAQAAIGQSLPVTGATSLPSGGITAVVPDFAIDAVDEQYRPAIYVEVEDIEHTAGLYGRTLAAHSADGETHTLINVKLTGRDIPETLVAIDKLLAEAHPDKPIDRQFLDDYIQDLYLVVRRQAQALAVAAGLAVLIACFGLAGLSASMAERRTKEVGIRKAMGAGTGDILLLLAWQFTRPILGSIAVAWLIAGLLMNRWLQGFAYHVELDPWVLAGAAALGLAIALGTVGTHCYLVARAKPVAALRYE